MAETLELLRRLRISLQNLVTRVVVDRSRPNAVGSYQVLWGGVRVSSEIEHLETQGVHFRIPTDGGGVVLCAGGQRDGACLIAAGGLVPNDDIAEGEGGLHYLGEWRVFIAADGTVHLGERDASDFVALASRVDAELSAIKADLDAFKSTFDNHTHPYVDSPAGPALTATPDSLSVPLGATAITFPSPHTPETVASETVRTV